MFHVTRCPNCHTSFRVTDAHLSAFEGKVRCGRCAFVFDAGRHFVGEPPLETLRPSVRPVEQVVIAPPPEPTPEPPAPAPAPEVVVEDEPHDEGYGADSMSAQLEAAASAESNSSSESMTQHNLKQLAAALSADTPAANEAQDDMLELDLDVDANIGIDDPWSDPPAMPAQAPASAPVDEAPAPLPDVSSSALDVTLDDLQELDLEAAAHAAAIAAAQKAAVAATPVAAEPPPVKAVVAEQAATVVDTPSPFTPAPPQSTPAASNLIDEQGPASTWATSAAQQGPETTYRPILTAEDEALLRVPEAPSPWRWLWSIPLFIALIALVGQLSYHYRTELSVQLPGIKPHLARFCAELGCSVELPARAELIRTEYSELTFVPDHPTLIQLSATARNQATFEQALPMLELTLIDDQDRVVAKKVFAAKDYLAPGPDGKVQAVPSSLQAGGDLRVFLRLDLGSMKSNGYQLYWFYPQPR